MRRTAAFLALCVTLSPLVLMAETTVSDSSGLEGVILVSPNHPGPIRKEVPSAGPAANLEFVVKRDEKTVASFTTDAEGRFRIVLPPGHYTVAREDPGARIGHWRFEAEVRAGEMTKVTLTGDSGMR